jgi:hypothetical protein
VRVVNTIDENDPDLIEVHSAPQRQHPGLVMERADSVDGIVRVKHVDLLEAGALHAPKGQPSGISLILADLSKGKGQMVILDAAEVRQLVKSLTSLADEWEKENG